MPNSHDGVTSAEIGQELAGWAFRKRGNHSEIHLSQLELAAMLALSAETAVNSGLRARILDIRSAKSPRDVQDAHLATFGATEEGQ